MRFISQENRFRVGLTSDDGFMDTPFGRVAKTSSYAVFVDGLPTYAEGTIIEVNMSDYTTYVDDKGFKIIVPA